MAIRLRPIGRHLVALCAAESDPEDGDTYLDDTAHHALATKFCLDFKEFGIKTEDIADPLLVLLMEREKKEPQCP